MYYADKVRTLQEIFGVRDIEVKADRVRIGSVETPSVPSGASIDSSCRNTPQSSPSTSTSWI